MIREAVRRQHMDGCFSISRVDFTANKKTTGRAKGAADIEALGGE